MRSIAQAMACRSRLSLSGGCEAFSEKKKGKYRLRDYTERGEDEKLGLPQESGETAPLVGQFDGSNHAGPSATR